MGSGIEKEVKSLPRDDPIVRISTELRRDLFDDIDVANAMPRTRSSLFSRFDLFSILLSFDYFFSRLTNPLYLSFDIEHRYRYVTASRVILYYVPRIRLESGSCTILAISNYKTPPISLPQIVWTRYSITQKHLVHRMLWKALRATLSTYNKLPSILSSSIPRSIIPYPSSSICLSNIPTTNCNTRQYQSSRQSTQNCFTVVS